MGAGIAGFGLLFGIFWLVGSLVILSIAIDSARSVSRANKIIELLEQQNRYLLALSSHVARSTPGDQPRAA
jgi:hypothetical protein